MAASKNSKSTTKKTTTKRVVANDVAKVDIVEKKSGSVYFVGHGRAYVDFGNNEIISYPAGNYKIGDIVER